MSCEETPVATLPPRLGDGERRRRREVLACASGVSFMIMLDTNIVAISLPAIAAHLHSAFAGVEWVMSAYILAFVSCLMPAGALADRFGRRRMLMIGLTIFGGASMLCGLAGSILLLNLGRALQGVGAALQLSAALAVLGFEFQGKERARAFAVWGVVIGAAAASGPIVGGLITSAFGWPWAFLINAPICALLIMLAWRSVRESRDPQHARIDLPGAMLLALAIGALADGMIQGGELGFGNARVILVLSAALWFLLGFIWAEVRHPRPMVDLHLFRDPAFVGANIAMLAYAASAYVMATYLPLYLQAAFFPSPAIAGLALLPFGIPLLVGPYLGAAMSARLADRGTLACGLMVVGLGDALIAWAATGHSYVLVALGMIVLGIGAGVLNGETARISMQLVPTERTGMASGLASTFRFVGLLAGLTGLGAILVAGIESYLTTLSADLPPLAAIGVRDIAHHAAAGGLSTWLGPQVPAAALTAWRGAAQAGFIAAFTELMAAAAAIAAAAAVLTLVLLHRPARTRGAA
ncbi:MFS transporter [Sodalis sp. RH21]|uniref:MFS transporter n=1 Tax=unclassified Sodalis (in: enterobacteria) TaxID=2636512 RepID=UPI0039B6D194